MKEGRRLGPGGDKEGDYSRDKKMNQSILQAFYQLGLCAIAYSPQLFLSLSFVCYHFLNLEKTKGKSKFERSRIWVRGLFPSS